MRVSVRFTSQGLDLDLLAETDQEKAMIGAVLNQPFSAPGFHPPELAETLVVATVHYEGHWTNKRVDRLTLRVHRQESGDEHKG